MLEDAWKPSRIRWGFPLDTPVEKLQDFKAYDLPYVLEWWQYLSWNHIDGLEINDYAKREKWDAAVEGNTPTGEAKLRAAFRVLLEMPDASLKEVVERFLEKGDQDEKKQEEFIRSLVPRLAEAVKAAEAAKAGQG